MRVRPGMLFVLVGCIFGPGAAPAHAADAGLFRRVAPLLQRRCLGCHNADKKRGGLDMTTRAALLRGGENGPVVKPGSAAGSRLLDMVRGPKAKMPREGAKLNAAALAALTA